MVAITDKPILEFETADEWEAWLEANTVGSHGVRLRLGKKTAANPGIRYPEALDVALCFGWIDGQSGSLDETHYLVSFSPRRPKGMWSQINRDHVDRLIAAGRMREAGQAEIDRAKADGRWDAAYRQKDFPVPDELRAALDANPAASAMFDVLSAQNRFAMLFRIGNVKRAETRARKIATYVEALERGETIYPQKATPSG
ncbi:MAG: hypothetical protein JWO10_1774 [Microbacteriaceae bacterium]|nr:hypothetical protein [Microbacteriaceae bacterium]